MNSKDNIIKYVLLSIVFIFASTLLVQKILGYDVWWHLKTGQYILEHKYVPAKDLYSYSAPDKEWINHQWLAQVIMYTAYKLSGFKGLILLKTIVYLATFCLLFMLSYKKRYPFLSILLISLGILAVSHRFLIRPLIFNAFFLSAYLYLLMRYKYDDKKRYIFFIPVLHLFWANIHGGYLTGILLMTLFLMGEGITWKLKISFLPKDPHCITGKKYRLLFYIFIITCLVTFINPNWIIGALHPITTLSGVKKMGWHQLIMTHISELQPTITKTNILSFVSYPYYKWLFVIVWAALIINIKRLQLTHLAVISIFSYFSIIAIRNVLTFAVVAVPIAMFNLDGFLSQIRLTAIKKIIHSKLLNAALFIPLGIVLFNLSASQFTARYLIEGKIVKSIGFGFNEWRYPFNAIDFIQTNNIPGNMFNTYESGGPLIWKTYPERKVFIDGRTDIYTPELFQDYIKMGYENPEIFEKFVKKYDINFALLVHSPPYGEKIIKYLFASKEWKLIYFDYIACVFLRDTPENAKLLEKFEIKDNVFPKEKEITGPIPKGTIPFSSFRRAEFFRLVGLYDNAISEYENTLKIDPELPIPRNSMGLCYYEKGDLEKAEQLFKETIEIAPGYAAPYNNLGSLYAQKKLFSEAEKYFKKAISLNKNYLKAHKNLANYYYESGQKEKAIKEYEKVVRQYPLDTNSYEKLGALYYFQERYEKAIQAFRNALQIEPERISTLSNIGITYAIIEDYKKAVEYGEKAIRIDPNYADGYYNLGLTYSFMGDDKKARKHWLQALKANPDHKKARENLQQLPAP